MMKSNRKGKYVGNINKYSLWKTLIKNVEFITYGSKIYDNNRRENEKKLNGTYYLILELFGM